jgi:hypothetical protein
LLLSTDLGKLLLKVLKLLAGLFLAFLQEELLPMRVI